MVEAVDTVEEEEDTAVEEVDTEEVVAEEVEDTVVSLNLNSFKASSH